jgi:hypothetical protein
MFPGFVTLYKDKDQVVHLYFYPGVDDKGNPIYKDLDISKTNLSYTRIDNEDNSKEFVFDTKDIIEMKCKLVKTNGDIDYENLTI